MASSAMQQSLKEIVKENLELEQANRTMLALLGAVALDQPKQQLLISMKTLRLLKEKRISVIPMKGKFRVEVKDVSRRPADQPDTVGDSA